jgi:hypothetical protein
VIFLGTMHLIKLTRVFLLDISPYPLPTTFETSTTSKDHESGSKGFAYPVPTVAVPSEETMPRNPNYPWGAGSPLHRHQNVTGLGDGILGGRSVLNWGKAAVHRLSTLFKKDVDEDEHNGGGGE